MMLVRGCAVLLLSFLLGGCQTIRYEYRPPASDQGRLCVTQCAAIKETCRGNEIHRAEYERSACERNSDDKYHACMRRAGNKEQEKECQRQRGSCYAHEDTGRCDSDYQQCFSNCGGRIIKHVEEY